MTGCAGVVAFLTVRVDQEGGKMAGLDAGGAATTDKGAVVRDVSGHPVGMAIYAGKGGLGSCSPLVNSVGNGAIRRIDSGADTIVTG